VQKLVEAALDALPVPDHSVVHIEVFSTEERGLVFNEIASRVGGAKIDRMLAAAFGRGPAEIFLRGVRFGPENVELPPVYPLRMASFAMTRPRRGLLTALPPTCPLPDVTEYEPLAAVGQELSDPVTVVSAIASVLTTGPSRAIAESRLAGALRWLEDGTVISGPVAQP
jgi:hypothetical protein